MPIIRGTYPGTIKTFSYTHYVTTDGGILCEECSEAALSAGSLQQDEYDNFSPIFADTEWHYYPECDVCEALADYVTLLTNDEE